MGALPSTTAAARRELLVIAAVVALVAVFRARLPHVLPLGALLLAGALLLLVHGLLRDLGRLKSAGPSAGARKITCVCVDSVVGTTTIVAGAALCFVWENVRVHVAPIAWVIGVACVCVLGTVTREIVFDWRTIRFRREPDHGARVVWRDAGQWLEGGRRFAESSTGPRRSRS